MAIKKHKSKDILKLEIDNGELKTLNAIIEKWKFKNEESFLRYALAIMFRTQNNVLYIDENNTKKAFFEKVALAPADDLILMD